MLPIIYYVELYFHVALAYSILQPHTWYISTQQLFHVTFPYTF